MENKYLLHHYLIDKSNRNLPNSSLSIVLGGYLPRYICVCIFEYVFYTLIWEFLVSIIQDLRYMHVYTYACISICAQRHGCEYLNMYVWTDITNHLFETLFASIEKETFTLFTCRHSHCLLQSFHEMFIYISICSCSCIS